MRGRNLHRLGSAGCRDNDVAVAGQYPPRHFSERFFVIDYKDRLGSHEWFEAIYASVELIPGSVLLGSREKDADRGPDTFIGIDPRMTTGLRNDSVHRRQPETRAFAPGLAREERFERAIADLRRHADAGVADAEAHVEPGRNARDRAFVLHDLPRRRVDRQRASSRHGVTSIDGKVENNLFDLTRVSHDHGQAGPESDDELDLLTDCAAQNLLHSGDCTVETQRARLPIGSARRP